MEYVVLAASALVTRLVNGMGRIRARGAGPERILVVKLDHLGDVVTATPVFRAIRVAYPESEIHALVGPWAEELLRDHPSVDRVLTYDARAFRRGARDPDAVPPLRRMRQIARHRYSIVVELRGDAWTLILPFLCGAHRRADRGTVRLRAWIARRLGGKGAAARAPVHEVETNLAVLRPIRLARGSAAGAALEAGSWRDVRVELRVTDADRTAIARRLAALGIAPDRPLVTIHPCAPWRPRAWRPERFASLARLILDLGTHDVIFLGAAEDRDVADALRASLSDARAHWAFGSLALREVTALIERSDVMIGNDSGLAHVAAAVGTPVVALFGPQDPARFRPWSESATALHHRVPCCPCSQRVCVRPELPCVNLIDVAEVFGAAQPHLETGGEGRARRRISWSASP